MSPTRAICFVLTLCVAWGVGGVRAQSDLVPTGELPNLNRIGVDERLDEQMPLDLAFRDHRGRDIVLGDLVGGEKPVLLAFAYFDCPVLCGLVLRATVAATKDVAWTAGDQYEVVVISIDPDDTPRDAAAKRAQVLEGYGRDVGDAGWHFLTAEQSVIDEATEAAGFRYFYQQAQDEYAHAAALMFLTPEGKFARYLYGIDFQASDLRLALLEASEGRSLSTVEQILVYCYQYQGAEEGYGLAATRIMQAGGGLVALSVGAALFFLWRREFARPLQSAADPRDTVSPGPPQMEAS